MIELLILILVLNSLWCIGFYTITYFKDDDDKMLLWWIRGYSEKYLGDYWTKPICSCPPCMASLHSLWYWLFFPIEWTYIPIYIFYIIALEGLNKLVVTKFDL